MIISTLTTALGMTSVLSRQWYPKASTLKVNRRLDHGRITVTLDIVAKLALFHVAILA